MSRNYGLGSRNMGDAGRIALGQACERGELSFSSVDTIADRFEQFAAWAKADGIGRMERIDVDVVATYGLQLAEKVEAGELSAAYAQNLVSAVNTVMALATKGDWQSVSPTKDCGIAERSAIRDEAPGALDRDAYGAAVQAVREELGDRQSAVVEMARELGLRSKEASLIDARGALQEAQERGAVTVSEGTKGGLEREVPITSPGQLETLQRAAEAQGGDKSMIPSDQTWKAWREGALREARDLVSSHTGGGLHDLRAAYACERYEALTGHAAPAAGGSISDRDADREARETIASELGHGRIDVVGEYVGGR